MSEPYYQRLGGDARGGAILLRGKIIGHRWAQTDTDCPACAAGLAGIGLFARVRLWRSALLWLRWRARLCFGGPFWQFPPMLLTGTAAAGGIALINSVGSLSGWVGPSVVGRLEVVTGKTATGLYAVAGVE